jgi:tetratricopeptide (TPR) repeat protein
MKKYILLTLVLSYNFVCAQEINTPAEIFKIMEKSEVSYGLEQLKKPIECKDQSENILAHNYYRIINGKSFETKKFELKKEAEAAFAKAEKFFSGNNTDSARFYYEKVLEIDPAYTKVITYIGQTYEQKGDYTNAIASYKRAIEKNYIDYMAHWFLADAYLTQGKIYEAADEITIALILNRNNPRIKEATKKIYEKAKINTADFCFTPQCKVESTASKKVTIAYGDNWLGYAMAKAVWNYEPGYKKSKGVEENSYTSTEEKECLANLYVGFKASKAKLSKHPELKALDKAVEAKELDEYMIFEVMLPENPSIAFQLSEDTIIGIKNYILKTRQAKK